MKAEDEQDVKAASLLKAEQDAELAEFNESIPLDDEVSAVSNALKAKVFKCKFYFIYNSGYGVLFTSFTLFTLFSPTKC